MALVECRECGSQISKKAKECPHCGAPQRRTSALTWFVAVIAVFMGAIAIFSPDAPVQGDQNRLDRGPTRSEALEGMELTFTWERSLDMFMVADLSITNNNAVDVKDLEITCVHFAKSGTQIDRNRREIFEIFPAGQTRSYPDFQMGFMHSQADKSACSISDLSLIQ
ncbi:MAG: zinc ribbon domain-containing protein [Pseudomonadota bacterium]